MLNEQVIAQMRETYRVLDDAVAAQRAVSTAAWQAIEDALTRQQARREAQARRYPYLHARHKGIVRCCRLTARRMAAGLTVRLPRP